MGGPGGLSRCIAKQKQFPWGDYFLPLPLVLVDFVAFFAVFFFAAMWLTPKNFGHPTDESIRVVPGRPAATIATNCSAAYPATSNDGCDVLVAETCLAFLRGLLVPSVRVARRLANAS